VFFGCGLGHLIFMATGNTRSHYGLTIGVPGQLAFAALDFSITVVLCFAHLRWSSLGHRPGILGGHNRKELAHQAAVLASLRRRTVSRQRQRGITSFRDSLVRANPLLTGARR
jgi:hypothetical protein